MMFIGLLMLVGLAFALALALLADRWDRRPLRLHFAPLDPSASTTRGIGVDRNGEARGFRR